LIEIVIPGRKVLRLEYLMLDLNGTIAFDGEIIEGVQERLEKLGKSLSIVVVTADTFGDAAKCLKTLPVKLHLITHGKEDVQKSALVKELGAERTVSIGNGSNDASMLKESALAIGVIGPEGASVEAIQNCDVVVPDIKAALDLCTRPDRLVATLRR
jgi:P-type E1-E2 ATPase